MDYTAILKKSWNVTWRYKILWLFGFLAGAAGGSGSSGGSSGSGWRQNSDSLPRGWNASAIQLFLERYALVIVIAALFLVALGVLMWIISLAARGGLIHLVNEAESGREVRAAAGWRAGFSKWWRIFGVSFLAGLPAGILGLVFAVFIAITVAGAVVAGRGSSDALAAAVVTALAGLCVFLIVFVIVAIVVGAVFGIVKELALRYVVLEDRRVMDALKTGWRDLWAKRGAFMMYLIQIGIGITYGIVAGVVAIVMGVPATLMLVVGNYGGGALLILAAALVLIVPQAIYGTFYHAAWTIFFRRMTGAEPVPVPAPGYPPVPPVPYPPAPAPEPPYPVAVEPGPGPAPVPSPEPQAGPPVQPPVEPTAGDDV